MKKAFRVFLALAILSGGTGIALLYRLESTATAPESAAGESQEVLHQGERATDSIAADPPHLDGSSDGIARPSAPGTEHQLTPGLVQQSAPPAPPVEGYPSRRSSSTAAGERDGLRSSVRPPATSRPARTHKIVDGDTLQEIARKYLGSASLAGDIFEANRAKLADPALLPIGVELTIPSGVQKTTPTPGSPIREPLVPVGSGRRSAAARGQLTPQTGGRGVANDQHQT